MSERGPRPDAGAQTIWIISKYASPAKYGFEARLFALAREMKELGRTPVIVSSDSNHLARFPPMPATYNRDEIDDVEVWWIRTLKYARTGSLRRVLSWIDFEIKLFFMPKQKLPKPDVILVSSLSLLTVLNGVWLRRRHGGKLIFEVRDIWPLTMVEEGGFSKSNPLVMALAWIERFGYRSADLIVGTMPNLKAHVARVTGEELPCVCVPFGFDPKFFQHSEELPPDRLDEHMLAGKFVVGYAGSIGVTNALETIMSCARSMAADERFFFLFVGEGDSRDRFLAETRDLKNVAFVPRVERRQLQSLLRRCDLLYFAVYDSPVWHYGMSLNKLIDYMMAAKPILASYSGYPSMLDEASCGEFVPAGDPVALREALLRFVESPPAEVAAMGLAGREWLVANRRWEVLAEDYLAHCDALVR